MNTQITFLGGGNMASALTAGLLKQGFSRDSIHIVQRNPEKREMLKRQFGVETSHDYASAIARADLVIFAVKPQSYPELLSQVSPLLQSRQPLLVSIMSGLRVNKLEQDNPGLSVVRVMPNTPSRVQAGLSLITPGHLVTDSQLSLVQTVFQAVGETQITPTERVFEQLTALTGCGPAFVYHLVQHFALGMQEICPEVDCLPLARATFEGALKMMGADPEISPEALIAQVAPKGGMTAEAMKVLGATDLTALFNQTFEAAIKRGDELGDST